MQPWWTRYPQALEDEKQALDALGYPWKIDEAEFAAGRLTITVEHVLDGVVRKLTAIYPTDFPYFVPQVHLEGPPLERHQQPWFKNLCLLARDGEDWTPGKDTLGTLLKDQFPKLLTVVGADKSSQLVADEEDHIGEPLSSFLPNLAGSVVVVPDETPDGSIASGRLLLKRRPADQETDGPLHISAVLEIISDLARKPLIKFLSMPSVFSVATNGYWLRLPKRPAYAASHQEMHDYFFAQMRANVPAFEVTLRGAKRGETIIAGFVYEDEVNWRASLDDWVFLAVRVDLEAKRSRNPKIQLHFIKADWGGEKAWMRRAPALLPLRNKSALVIGLGSLGSPLTLHLARAGIKQLDLVDYDELQVGNTVRWALGWKYAGMNKASALAAYIAEQYPYTTARPHNMRIGALDLPDAPGTNIRALCQQSDLIIDAAANHRVSHFLADLAMHLGKPYLWLTTTHGAAGGVVGRVIPGKPSGCWHCFQHGLTDESITPPSDTGDVLVQPAGCSQPTFIGAGIDSDEIALLGARLAVATLSDGKAEGYPDFRDDIFVADLNLDGKSVAPTWRPCPPQKHSACQICSKR